jgi:PAS domain S-box-containing protein
MSLFALPEQLLDAMEQAVVAVDLAGQVTYWNPFASQLYGWSASEAIGRIFWALILPAEEQAEPLRSHLQDGVAWVGELPVQHRGGVSFVVAMINSPLRNTTGKLIGMVSVANASTVQHAAEAALRTSEANLRALIEHASDAIFIANESRIYVDVNAAACALSGYTREELIGKRIEDLTPPPLWPRLDDDRSQLIDGTQTLQGKVSEWVLLRKDGTTVPIEVSAKQLPDGRWQAFVRDSTVHRNAEARQNFLVNLGESMAHIQDPGELLDSVSSQLGKFLGVAHVFFVEANAETGQLSVHNEHHHALPTLTGAYPLAGDDAAHQAAYQYGQTVVINDTAIDPATINHYATRYAPGQIRTKVSVPLLRYERWVGNLLVTDHQPRQWSADEIALIEIVAEQAWLALENRRLFQRTSELLAQLETTLDNAPVGLAIFDRQHCCIHLNEQLAALHGRTPADYVGRPLDVTPPLAAIAREQITKVFANGLAINHCEVSIGPEATAPLTHYLLVSYYPVRIAQTTTYVGVVTVDITERKELEEELRALNATLEQQVLDRTAQLQQSNRDLDQFAYIASHDLKTPLRAINNLSTWISEDAEHYLPAESKTHLSKLRVRVRRIEKLVDDLLAYSRAGRVQHAVEVVNVKLLIEDILETSEPPPGFQIICDPALPQFATWRVPLETVLRNLISNAFKHHGGSTGQVMISARPLGDGFEFAVADDGAGIAPEYHTRIFEMFQTLKPRDQVDGSGIGLAVVKRLVEAFNGKVTVESTPGHGATFRFTWPRS